jgi:hypothetical protein
MTAVLVVLALVFPTAVLVPAFAHWLNRTFRLGRERRHR